MTSNDPVGYEVLNILARFPLAELAAERAVISHLLGEATGHAFADNVQHYGDPDHGASPCRWAREPRVRRAPSALEVASDPPWNTAAGCVE